MSEMELQGSLRKKNYFEGWYYKNVTVEKGITISIIPGISTNKKDPHAFIQVIETINHQSYYIRYDIKEVKIKQDPFCLRIGNSYFYQDYIDLSIHDENLDLTGLLYYSEMTPLETSLYAPTIMGPFSYLPMECNHAIISMNHYIDGILNFNGEEIDFEDGYGYIEKDYGTSFPEKYLWLQSNTLEKDNLELKKASIFLSVAKIPLGFTHFKGFIACLLVNEKQYRFASYNLSQLKIEIKQGIYLITMTKKHYKLKLRIKPNHGKELKSPRQGRMEDTIQESLDSTCSVILYHKHKVLLKQKFTNCGFENMGY